MLVYADNPLIARVAFKAAVEQYLKERIRLRNRALVGNGRANNTAASRAIHSLFSNAVPQLWVPTLVFYDETGRIDHERQLAHLAFMTPYLQGLLVPGSTGDGWATCIPHGLSVPSLHLG